MTEEMRKIYEGYLQADKNDLATQAREYFKCIFSLFRAKTDDKDTALEFAMCVFSTFVAQDGNLDNSEWALLDYIFQNEIPREKAVEMIKESYDESTYGQIKEIVSRDGDMKLLVVKLGLCVCAIDGRVSDDEDLLLSYFID